MLWIASNVSAVSMEPNFYGLPRNVEHITLAKEPGRVAHEIGSDSDSVIPWRAAETMVWKLAEECGSK